MDRSPASSNRFEPGKRYLIVDDAEGVFVGRFVKYTPTDGVPVFDQITEFDLQGQIEKQPLAVDSLIFAEPWRQTVPLPKRADLVFPANEIRRLLERRKKSA